MSKSFRGKRGPGFVDVEFDPDFNENMTPEMLQRKKYEHLIRCAANDFSSPLNDFQKTICNLLMEMNQITLSYATNLVIAKNNYKKYDEKLISKYKEQIDNQMSELTCIAEDKLRKSSAWYDVEGVTTPLEEKIRTFDCKTSNNPKDWS